MNSKNQRMIFLSAQPDAFYFTWQIELQIFNFNNFGIQPDNIHILLGYDAAVGLENHFAELIERLKHKASFFTYADKRAKSKYASSLRPHIIQQHLQRFPELEREAIFYHDSDILFRELPDFSKMLDDEIWYVSDTRSYLDSNYIKNIGGQQLLLEMCGIIGIESEKVILQDTHCGGAQYLLKNVPITFWAKLERDSENLYIHLTEVNSKNVDFAVKGQEQKKIQAWCADMWALLWNGVLYNKNIEINKEMDFCWANSPIEKWSNCKILHYTGSTSQTTNQIFIKHNYSEFPPYYDLTLNEIDPNSASASLVDFIRRYVSHLESERIDISDTLLIILFESDKCRTTETLVTQLKYLEKYFNVNVYIVEKGTEQLFRNDIGLKIYGYTFCGTQKESALANILLKIIKRSHLNIFALIKSSVFLHTWQYTEACRKIRSHQSKIVIPNNEILKVDRLFQSIFDKCLDAALLKVNNGKFNRDQWRDVNCIFFNKDAFLETAAKGVTSFDSFFDSMCHSAANTVSKFNYPAYHFAFKQDFSD